jgi:hypothetical protein
MHVRMANQPNDLGKHRARARAQLRGEPHTSGDDLFIVCVQQEPQFSDRIRLMQLGEQSVLEFATHFAT